MTAGPGPSGLTAPLPPLPFTTYPKKGKQLLLLLLNAAFAAVGVMMVRDGKEMGWFCAGVFGLGTVIFLLALLPGNAYLTVSELGLEYATLFRKHRLQWSEVEEFGTYTIRQHGLPVSTMVGFNYSPSASKPTRARAAARFLAGFEGGLPDTYGFKAQELAEILNAYHQRFVYRSGSR